MSLLDRDDWFFIAGVVLVLAGPVAILIAAAYIGFDGDAATRAARGHAAAWADEHGYAGPVDCGTISGRWDDARCAVRAGRGQPIGAVLSCDAKGCVEFVPEGQKP